MSLHNHTMFSQLDGIGEPERHAAAAKDQGLEGLAITDHALNAGWLQWEKAMKKEGLNPLFGVETYFALDRIQKHKEVWGQHNPSHLLLIAKNAEGLRSINRIVADSYLEGFYGKPRTDWSVLRENSEGVIATTGCVNGPPGRFLEDDDLGQARNWIASAMDVFGDDFYLELQTHPFDQQINLNKFLCDINQAMDLPLVVTNDSHYARPEDAKDQRVSVCVATKSTLAKPALQYTHDFSVKGFEQLHRELQEFTNVPEWAATQAVSNASRILSKTKVELPKGVDLAPAWPNAESELYKLLSEGLGRKITDLSKRPQYRKRLRYEYDIIVNKGFAEYFLVVADMVRAAKERGVFVGCGRGSAGGSLVAFLLDITEVDPIRWDLDMERFISPNRGGYEMSFHNATEITELMTEYEERYVV